MPYDPTTGIVSGALTDGLAPQSAENRVGADLLLWNGATSDRMYNNIQAVLVPAGARTAAPAIATQANANARGLLLFLNVTASPGVVCTLTLTLRALDPVTGTAFTALLTAAAISATTTANSAAGLYTYGLYPGFPATAAAMAGLTLAQNGILPRVWTANVAHSTADSWTYSLAYQTVL